MKFKLKEVEKRILEGPRVKALLDWSQRFTIRGFSKVPLYQIVKFILDEAQKDNLTTRANSVAYSFFLSIFPAILFIFTLLPYLPFTADYTEMLRENSESFLPKDAHDYLFTIIYDITAIKRQGLLSLGFILTVFFSSNGMLTLMFGFDKSYAISYHYRSYFRKRMIAIILTILLSLLLIVAVVAMLITKPVYEYLLSFTPEYFIVWIELAKYFILILLVYTGISFIYKYGPSLKKKTDFINPGSILATLLLIVTTWGFSFFINNFGRYNELYGSIGALIALMLLFQINAFVILVGYELNAAIAVNRDLMAFAASEDDDKNLGY